MEVKRESKGERGDRTRSQLLRAAEAMFAERGYASTSLAAIVLRTGVTKGALYHHFRDKRALLEALVTERVRHVVATAQEQSRTEMQRRGLARHGWERLAAGLDVFFLELCNPEARQVLLIDGPAVLGRARWDDLWIEHALPLFRRILSRAAGSPGVPERHREPLARILLGGIQEAAQAIASSDEPDRLRDAFAGSMSWLLSAIHRQARDDR